MRPTILLALLLSGGTSAPGCSPPDRPLPNAGHPHSGSAVRWPVSTSAPTAPALASETPPAPSVSPPSAPPYDLAADLLQRKEALRAELGANTAFQLVEDVFLLASPAGTPGKSAYVAQLALGAYFNQRFSRKPERAVSVLLFPAAPPYDAYCRAHYGSDCSTPFGFYQRASRTVVMNVAPGIGTLTHELVHPIVESDFPGAPDWIDEGIASLYEAFTFPKAGEIRGRKNFRHPNLLAALRSDPEQSRPNLPALFAKSDDVFRGPDESLNYATARYFCQWMDSQRRLWPFYRAWRDDFANDPSGVKAFARVMGKSPSEANAAWVAWVTAL
jgi:hypothetical protein